MVDFWEIVEGGLLAGSVAAVVEGCGDVVACSSLLSSEDRLCVETNLNCGFLHPQ